MQNVTNKLTANQKKVLFILENREEKYLIDVCYNLDKYLSPEELTLEMFDKISTIIRERLKGIDLHMAEKSLDAIFKKLANKNRGKSDYQKSVDIVNMRLDRKAEELGLGGSQPNDNGSQPSERGE